MSFLRRAITSARSVAPVLLEAAAPSNKISFLQSSTRSFSNLSPVSASLCKVSNAFPQDLHREIHSKSEKELLSTLQEQISEEKENSVHCPLNLQDFSVEYDHAEVSLTKNYRDEVISIVMNVNHTVAPQEEENDQQEENVDSSEMAMDARPDFMVDVAVGDKKMSFTCAFVNVDPPGEFGISEVVMYEGDSAEKHYSASGDLLDENLYSSLMGYLGERGIDDNFAQELSALCFDYEHSLYVKLMQDMEAFLNRK